jgi:hypothetical protein
MPSLRLRLGWEAIEHIHRAQTHRAVGASDDAATIELSVEELLRANVAYTPEAAVDALQAGSWEPLFTGLVQSVDFDGDNAIVSLVGNQRPLQEVSLGGLVIGDGADAAEMVFSLLRTTGWPADRIVIEGWQPGPAEVFLVASPIEGVDIVDDSTLLGVTLSSTNPARTDLPTSEQLVGEFLDAGTWAYAAVEAESVFDAEVAGLNAIDLGLSAFRAISSYSYPQIVGQPRPFNRDHTRAMVTASDIVFVGSLVSKRRWLRRLTDKTAVPRLALHNVMRDIPVSITPQADIEPDLARALREWRVASESKDDLVRVTHLWRAVECYSRRSNPENLFRMKERKNLLRAALTAAAWSDEQARRIEQTVGMVNSPPLLTRFRASLKADCIALPEEQFDVLRSTRPMRNELEHGRTLSPFQHRLLDNAISVANYVLLGALLTGRRAGGS